MSRPDIFLYQGLAGPIGTPGTSACLLFTEPAIFAEALVLLGSFDAPPQAVPSMPTTTEHVVFAEEPPVLGSFDLPSFVAPVTTWTPFFNPPELAPEPAQLLGSVNIPFPDTFVPPVNWVIPFEPAPIYLESDSQLGSFNAPPPPDVILPGFHITGLEEPTGMEGNFKIVYNLGPGNLTLDNESALSAVQKRFLFATGDLTLVPNASVLLLYDPVTLRWRGIGRYT